MYSYIKYKYKSIIMLLFIVNSCTLIIYNLIIYYLKKKDVE